MQAHSFISFLGRGQKPANSSLPKKGKAKILAINIPPREHLRSHFKKTPHPQSTQENVLKKSINWVHEQPNRLTLEIFQKLPNPRIERSKVHSFKIIMFIALCANCLAKPFVMGKKQNKYPTLTIPTFEVVAH